MSPARATSSRSPTRSSHACSQAAFAGPYLLPGYLVELGRRQGRCALIGTDGGVGGVHVAGGDVGPVRGVTGQGYQGAAGEPGLPRHVDHRVPGATPQPVVGAGLAPIGGHEHSALRDRTAIAPRQAGHRVTLLHGLASELTSQPGRTAQHQQLHDAQ